MSLIDILLPVHNGAGFLARAIESVLGQTFTDWRLLIVDDGSDDGTDQVLGRVSDSRIQITHQANRLGVAQSLNHGLSLSFAPWIARIDADDSWHPAKLSSQLELTDYDPNLVIVGTWATVNSGVTTHWRYPVQDHQIRQRYFFSNPFNHSSVLFKRSALQEAGGQYSTKFKNAEDYELWFRILCQGLGANLTSRLVMHSRHSGQVSNNFNFSKVNNLVRAEALGSEWQVPQKESSFALYKSLVAVNWESLPFDSPRWAAALRKTSILMIFVLELLERSRRKFSFWGQKIKAAQLKLRN